MILIEAQWKKKLDILWTKVRKYKANAMVLQLDHIALKLLPITTVN